EYAVTLPRSILSHQQCPLRSSVSPPQGSISLKPAGKATRLLERRVPSCRAEPDQGEEEPKLKLVRVHLVNQTKIYKPTFPGGVGGSGRGSLRNAASRAAVTSPLPTS